MSCLLSAHKIRLASDDVRLNTAHVHTTLDLEEALHTPCRAPRVGNQPVVKATLLVIAPSNDLDRVPAGQATRAVHVHTALVGEEVLVDSEAGLHWTVLKDLGLNGRLFIQGTDGTWLDVVWLERGTVSTARMVTQSIRSFLDRH